MLELFSRLEVGVVAGALLAEIFILVVRTFARRGEIRVYSIGLVVTGVMYLIFGVVQGAPLHHLGVEAVGAVMFSGAALLALRRWPGLLGLAWCAHAAWDLFLHHAAGPSYAPAWYPMLCVGFDLVLGGYIAGVTATHERIR
jgi:hypothetical protein